MTKSFQNTKKNKLQVLKNIELSIEEKKISVIIGSSGAGKSTLLHIISGLDRPDSGEVFFDTTNIFSYSEDKLAKFRNNNIGFVFQFHHLLPEFTALENIIIPQLIKGVSLHNAQIRSKELLNDLGLTVRADHKPAELSGGEQQRVAIARALANDPAVIFADEPTGNLDSENSRIIHNLLFELRDKYQKTFVIVTHNPEMVGLADQIFEIKDGVIVKEDKE
ncbi:MAG: ABC transporter ATP-binding protein [Bacteroidota bacterium]|nr:ABC transporter ATP-binding protein [Bacteroidota bacterium]